ncbi:hypothetical protein B484DRAFT_435403 [Ochromonadaceae sp. CCMP2298]|nr:hypothetical protein B484DRAFT_435403 [Ochromonadaceae sp. CCMP2298]|mmetsp:Transcript_11111/g.24680  ORF Transcript_11111/g.24680 Transcript_11111/m.24680 type:complete len:161 (-) Transcript_11111:1744-2226(-)|eukprot:CAMPEP_0173170734 /NCGR_PEP_ID=MMETSP1141-20130122/1385_1 /TAXON_ID=483371 /ORGANISM="non described non described, Strain CCMP2298" /LENGTH=160 /DNA_ID=CAMNT_0014092627 /DNA_START=63 /DNA_END=545 /DNA_ORIENTATION=-
MTEVSYGQFFDAFEDNAAPLAESNEQEQSPAVLSRGWLKSDSLPIAMIAKIFRAMERINNNQLDGYDSSISLDSRASMASLSAPPSAFGVVQSILINDFGSTNSLSDLSLNDREPLVVPALLQHMLYVFEEFMHNHSFNEDITRVPSPQEEVQNEFPKFC